MTGIWDSRVQSHSLWPVVEAISTDLNSLSVPEGDASADALSRLQWMIETLKSHRDVEDARGYTSGMLDRTLAALSAGVQVSVAQYVSDPATYSSSLTVAADQVDAVVESMATWPQLTQRGTAIAAGQAAAQYERSSKASLEELRILTEGVKAQLDDLASQNAGFRAKEQEDNAKEFADWIAEKSRSVDDLTARLSDSATEADMIAGRLREMEDQGSNIVSALARKAVANDYARYARNKSVGGWIWDGFGVVIGGAFGWLLLQHLFDEGAPTDTVQLGLTRLAVSITGLGLAALCFRRGSQNHAEARRAKRAHLRISTAPSFMANQDEEFQDYILKGMADRIYLQGIVSDDTDGRYEPGMLDSLRAHWETLRGKAPDSKE